MFKKGLRESRDLYAPPFHDQASDSYIHKYALMDLLSVLAKFIRILCKLSYKDKYVSLK